MLGVGETRLRVVCADDHPSVRENLRYLIDAEPDLQCVAVARDGVEAVRACEEQLPDVLVVDEDMPRGTGLEVIQWLSGAMPDLPIILYTLNSEACAKAQSLGAAGCVIKDSPYGTLLNAIRQAGSRRSVVTPGE
jgi:DNA-binding NarL/FixJ family response regulator